MIPPLRHPKEIAANSCLLLDVGCGSSWRFEVSCPKSPLTDDDTVLYRIDDRSGGIEAGEIPLSCDAEGGCRSRFGDGSGGIAAGSPVLVWLDLAADDWEEMLAASPPDPGALAPDDEDPRGSTIYGRSLGPQQLRVVLRTPDAG
ncbi:MAG: hypothetical protein H6735_19185 [Alphaproteobacteria bacterium]|nr:hypothetical protein [Alphaproteobacteria bacterium]